MGPIELRRFSIGVQKPRLSRELVKDFHQGAPATLPQVLPPGELCGHNRWRAETSRRASRHSRITEPLPDIPLQAHDTFR